MKQEGNRAREIRWTREENYVSPGNESESMGIGGKREGKRDSEIIYNLLYMF